MRLRAALDERLPAKRLDRNLLIATWNIRAFGDLTEEWDAGPDASPKRDLHALALITEIVSRFDVIAIQEVKGNIKALRRMMSWLGGDWGLILTDVTRGSPGNDERLAFVFDLRCVRPSGLAGELVIPEEWAQEQEIEEHALEHQFATDSLRGQLHLGGPDLHPGHAARRLRREARRSTGGARRHRPVDRRLGIADGGVQPEPPVPRGFQHRQGGGPQLRGVHLEGPQPA